jgi:hypothetical protein
MERKIKERSGKEERGRKEGKEDKTEINNNGRRKRGVKRNRKKWKTPKN